MIEYISKEPITKGWSGDKKYCVTTADGTKYLLRISPIEQYDRKKSEFEMMQRVAALGVPMCQPIEFGTCDEGVYSLQSWINGQDAEDVIPTLSDTEQYAYGLEKLGGIFKNNISDWISVDFSPWGSNPNAYNKFVDIKAAILQCRVIEIDYINAQNKKSTRKIEPLRLDFKYQAWYLWGWCKNREDFRSFRISRIKRVTITDETFERDKCLHHTPNPKNDKNTGGWNSMVHCVLQFTEGALYRLYDDYDDDQIHDNGDGTYTLELDFPEDDWVYGYILSFGTYVKVLSPEHLCNIIKDKSEKIARFYK